MASHDGQTKTDTENTGAESVKGDERTGEAVKKPENKTKEKNEEETKKEEKDEFRVVLVGKTGMGKSSLGNSLLSKPNQFNADDCAGAVTEKVEVGEHKITVSGETKTLKIYDTPGMFDAAVSISDIMNLIVTCITESHPGPHIFLFVMKMERMSKEHLETIALFKNHFGDKVLDYIIIIFTCKDQIKKSVEDWFQSACTSHPEFKTFIDSCNTRYQSINNDGSDKNQDVDRILELIHQTIMENRKNNCEFYTNAMCETAKTFYLQKQEEEIKEAEAELRTKIRKEERGKILGELLGQLPPELRRKVESALQPSTSDDTDHQPENKGERTGETETEEKNEEEKGKRGRVRGPMNESDETTLKKNIPKLSELITEPGRILESLCARDVFDREDREKVEREKNVNGNRAGVTKLLNLLLDCGSDALQPFKECLIECGYNQALELLGFNTSSQGSSNAETGVVKLMSTRAYQAKQSPSSSTGTKPRKSQVTTKTADKDESGDNDVDGEHTRQDILPASSRGSSSAETSVVKPMSTRAYQAKQSPSSSTGTKPRKSQVTTKTAELESKRTSNITDNANKHKTDPTAVSSRGSSSAETGVVKSMTTRAFQAKQSPSSTGTKSQVTTKTTGSAMEEEIKLVLIGRSGAGKSSLGNSLLQDQKFNVSRFSGTAMCETADCYLNDGTKLFVTDTPGFSSVERSDEQTASELRTGLQMTTPGPHLFVLVMSLQSRYSDEDLRLLDYIYQIHQSLYKYMIVVFTGIDALQEEQIDITTYIHKSPPALKEFIEEKIENKYEVINNKDKKSKYFTDKIMKLVRDTITSNNNTIFSLETPPTTSSTCTPVTMVSSAVPLQRGSQLLDENDLRIVLLGKAGIGKSSLGNSLLGERKFQTSLLENKGTTCCQLESRRLNERSALVIIDTPGFYRTTPTSREAIDEVLTCVNANKPNVFILVLSVSDRFKGDEMEGMKYVENVFGPEVFKHMIVVFTWLELWDDDDTHVGQEKIIPQSARPVLSRCGERYACINNKGKKQEEMRMRVQNILDMASTLVKQNNYSCYTKNIRRDLPLNDTHRRVAELENIWHKRIKGDGGIAIRNTVYNALAGTPENKIECCLL